jgi:hypothetical protein
MTRTLPASCLLPTRSRLSHRRPTFRGVTSAPPAAADGPGASRPSLRAGGHGAVRPISSAERWAGGSRCADAASR